MPDIIHYDSDQANQAYGNETVYEKHKPFHT